MGEGEFRLMQDIFGPPGEDGSFQPTENVV